MGKQPLTPGPNGEFLAEGYNGQLLVKRDRVIIIRKGMMSLMTQGLKGDKEIPLANITAIQLKQPGMTAGTSNSRYPVAMRAAVVSWPPEETRIPSCSMVATAMSSTSPNS